MLSESLSPVDQLLRQRDMYGLAPFTDSLHFKGTYPTASERTTLHAPTVIRNTQQWRAGVALGLTAAVVTYLAGIPIASCLVCGVLMIAVMVERVKRCSLKMREKRLLALGIPLKTVKKSTNLQPQILQQKFLQLVEKFKSPDDSTDTNDEKALIDLIINSKGYCLPDELNEKTIEILQNFIRLFYTRSSDRSAEACWVIARYYLMLAQNKDNGIAYADMAFSWSDLFINSRDQNHLLVALHIQAHVLCIKLEAAQNISKENIPVFEPTLSIMGHIIRTWNSITATDKNLDMLFTICKCIRKYLSLLSKQEKRKQGRVPPHINFQLERVSTKLKECVKCEKDRALQLFKSKPTIMPKRHEKLQPLQEADKNATVNLLRYDVYEKIHYSKCTTFAYNAEGISGYGWACTWRAMQTSFSAYNIYPSLDTLFTLFAPLENLLFLYKHKHGKELISSKVFAPYDLSSGWAELLVAELAMHYYGISSRLETVNKIPDHCSTPKEAFAHAPLKFSEFRDKLISHFQKKDCAAVIIDNVIYTVNIIGVGFTEDTTTLLIADPHIKTGEHGSAGIYTVTLDATGKRISCSIYQSQAEQLSHSGSYNGLDFDQKPWMVLFPTGRMASEENEGERKETKERKD